jgi:hypothetical protein
MGLRSGVFVSIGNLHYQSRGNASEHCCACSAINSPTITIYKSPVIAASPTYVSRTFANGTSIPNGSVKVGVLA